MHERVLPVGGFHVRDRRDEPPLRPRALANVVDQRLGAELVDRLGMKSLAHLGVHRIQRGHEPALRSASPFQVSPRLTDDLLGLVATEVASMMVVSVSVSVSGLRARRPASWLRAP
ncbi:hypothetical protein [Streptomyces wedmorensis]|uniref:hypothetical protein n=1 Tax=Streptomyces wedmorensis TaxID=43759 RepID=UPI0037A5CA4E